jgi:alpha-L-fucosidase 2
VQRLIDAGAFAEAQALADQHVMGVPRTQMAYQIPGDLLLELPGITDVEGSDYHRELDLDAAVATTRFRAGGTRFRREVLASTIDQVVAVQLVADRPFELLIGLTSPQRETKIDVAGPVVTLTGRNGSRAGIEGALQFTARAQVVASGAQWRRRATEFGSAVQTRSLSWLRWRPTSAGLTMSAAIRTR